MSRGAHLVVIGVLAACVAPPVEVRDPVPVPVDDAAVVVDDGWDVPEAEEPDEPAVAPLTCTDGTTLCNLVDAFGFGSAGPGYGRAVSLVDVDGDGLEDVWRSEESEGFPDQRSMAGLWRNTGGGRFEPWDVGIDEEALRFNWSGVWGDVDADGDPDLLLVGGGFDGVGPLSLWLNDVDRSGRFWDATASSGLTDRRAAWWGSSFSDYDRDGDLDVVVTSLSGVWFDWKALLCEPETGGSVAIEGPVILYRNRGDGVFEDVTASAGLPTELGNGKTPVWWDADHDGDEDLFLAVYARPDSADRSYLLRNDGDGTFTDVTSAWLPGTGWDRVFVAAASDFDQDGDDDLYLGRFEEQQMVVINDRGGALRLRGYEAGIDLDVGPTSRENAMGLAVGDLDLDGWPDVIVGPGSPQIRGRPVALCNVTDLGTPFDVRFSRCGLEMTLGHEAAMHHGTAIGDLDGDLDPDVLFNLGGAAFYDVIERSNSRQRMAAYLRDDPEMPRSAAIRLRASASPPDGVGARLTVVGSATHHLRVRSAQGFMTHNGSWQLVPLGTAEVGEVTVSWPSGVVTRHPVRAGYRWVLAEEGGQERLVMPPRHRATPR